MSRRATLPPDPRDLTLESLWCRTERHEWRWDRDTLDDDMTEFVRHRSCRRCGARHEKAISLTTFEVLWARIVEYPDGYLVRGGRLAQRDLYREQFRREGTEHRDLIALHR